MADAITLIVSLVIIYLILRLLLGSQPAPSSTRVGAGAGRLGGAAGTSYGRIGRPRRLHVVNPAQTDAVAAMFPHFPRDTIEADLLLTGSVEATCDRILSGALLPPPQRDQFPSSSPSSSHPSMNHSTLKLMKLDDSQPVGEEPEKVWESTPAARQANLKARKEHMIRLARERLKNKTEKIPDSA